MLFSNKDPSVIIERTNFKMGVVEDISGMSYFLSNIVSFE
jgi:hypothetical protein